MQLGVVGLGRMGSNIVRRLMRNGHRCVVYNRNPDPVQELARAGATPATSRDDLATKLEPPRAAWVMLPAGDVTEAAVMRLGASMDAGDILIDGGNSHYRDDVRRARGLAAKGVRYLDVGTSGGVWGLERG